MPHDLRPDPPSADPADALDRDGLRAVARGDRRAIEALYRRHQPRLARFLRRRLGRLDLVDDVVNETFWVVWRRAADFRGDSKVATWITGIGYRCMLKALRSATPAEEASWGDLGETPADEASTSTDDARELRDWIAAGLRSLPDEQRTTVELAYFMGQSCDDIAAIMGCPVGTVKARLFHARVRLRTVLPALAGSQAAG